MQGNDSFETGALSNSEGVTVVSKQILLRILKKLLLRN